MLPIRKLLSNSGKMFGMHIVRFLKSWKELVNWKFAKRDMRRNLSIQLWEQKLVKILGFFVNTGSFAHSIECKEDGFVCNALFSHHSMNFYGESLEWKLINISYIKTFNRKVKRKNLVKDTFRENLFLCLTKMALLSHF